MIFRQQKFLPPSPMTIPAVCCKNHGAVQKKSVQNQTDITLALTEALTAILMHQDS